MTAHEEIELKWGLAAEAHARLAGLLAGLLGAGLRLEQENRFYDAADLRLRTAGMNLRLRRENDRTIVTSKRRRTIQADGAFRHDEWEQEVAADLWSLPAEQLAGRLPLPVEARAVLGQGTLRSVGGFANLRFTWQDGLHLLCLDRTTFPGAVVEHELEIETSDPLSASTAWSARLAAWNVPWAPQPLTKFARFLRHAGG